MTDLDTLRHALRAADETRYAASPLDIRQLTTRGRRLRTRRRIAMAAAGACAAAGLAVAVTGISGLTGPSRTAPAQFGTPPAPSSPAPHPGQSPVRVPTAVPTRAAGSPVPSMTAPVKTGQPVSGGNGPTPMPSTTR